MGLHLFFLQVIRVLSSSLAPHLTDAATLWTPQRGYEVVEVIPHNLGTIFAGSGCTSVALLRKTSCATNNHTSPSCPASLSGILEGRDVLVPSSHLELVDPGSSKAAELLLKVAAFMKIDSLEEELFAGHARRAQSQQEVLGEPPSKRLRMNGVLHDRGQPLEEKNECTVEDEIISFSLHFGIPSILTHLYPSPSNGEPAETVILPDSMPIQRHPQQEQHQEHRPLLLSTEAPLRHPQRRRKRPRSSMVSSLTSSLSSLAKGTVNTLGSVIKTAVSITTLGLVNIDESREESVMEVGERIEDQIYHEEKLSRIHWDKYHQLVFPTYYYLSHPGNQGDPTIPQNGSKGQPSSRPGEDGSCSDARPMTSTAHVAASSASPSEGRDMSVSGNSDLLPQVEVTNIASAPPTSYYPIVLLQQFSGGWSLSQPLCHATGVPMSTFLSLPLCSSSSPAAPSTNNFRHDSIQAAGRDGHFWATVVALTCLKELFQDAQDEWCLVARKGEVWLEERGKYSPVSLQQAREISRGLVVREDTIN